MYLKMITMVDVTAVATEMLLNNSLLIKINFVLKVKSMSFEFGIVEVKIFFFCISY